MPTANRPTARLFSRARMLFLALIAATLAQLAWYYPRLPARVASHFDAAGQANAFMPKDGFLAIHLVVLGILAVVFLLIPALIGRLPPSMINLPNKDYWLAPERRAGTFAYIEQFFAWFGCALLLLVVFAMGLAMRANFSDPVQLPTVPIVSAIAAFILFNIAGVIAMHRRFSTIR